MKDNKAWTGMTVNLPSVSGKTIFSVVVVCFMVPLSKCSKPFSKLRWFFSWITTIMQKQALFNNTNHAILECKQYIFFNNMWTMSLMILVLIWSGTFTEGKSYYMTFFEKKLLPWSNEDSKCKTAVFLT